MFRRALRPRVLVYATLLTVAGAAFATSVALRKPFLFDVIKDRGTLARIVDEGAVENIYRLQVMNRSEAPHAYRVKVTGLPGLVLAAPELKVPAAGVASVIVAVRLPAELAQAWAGRSVPLEFEVALQADATQAATSQREKSTFFVPR